MQETQECIFSEYDISASILSQQISPWRRGLKFLCLMPKVKHLQVSSLPVRAVCGTERLVASISIVLPTFDMC